MQAVRYLVPLAVVAFAYWGAARLSLNLALVHGQVTPIWPPTGIALVTFLTLGRRMWPAIALAAFAVNLPLGPSPLGAALIACGNTLAPLVSTELLRRAGFHRQLNRMRDATELVVLAALIGMTISATVGSAVLVLSGTVPMTGFAPTWAVWWAGDAMGVLLVAPMLLTLIPPRLGLRRLGWLASAELTLLLVGIGAVTYFLFENEYRLEYLVLPLIAVAAWRFRLAGAAPAALIASVIAAFAAVNGVGAFASETLLEKMVTLQAFNISLSLASFLLSSFVDARQQRGEMERLYESARVAIATKTDAIDVAAHERAVTDRGAGAVVVFQGVVRDHDHGRQVTVLEYEAHPSAEAVLREVAEEIGADPAVYALAVSHRVGRLEIGDVALVAAVSTAHRATAFAACARLVDEVKTRLPVWKRQVFADGAEEWVNCP